MTFSRYRMLGHRGVAVVIAAALAACLPSTGVPQADTAPAVRLVSPAGVSIAVHVEVADDPASRSLGLMHRTQLPEKQGMLFVFPEQIPLAFWMKNTLIPLDVLYFDGSGRYVSHAVMQPCTGDPCPSYAAAGRARYALEVNAGFTDAHAVGTGWTLALENIDVRAAR